MGEQSTDFWQNHSLHFLEMAFRTDRLGRLTNPDGYGKSVRECGDTIEYFLTVSESRIDAISMETNSCLETFACANAVAHLVEGKSLAEAWDVTADTVMNFLESLPPEQLHCAELAVNALYAALASIQEIKRDPWKKLYHIQ